MEWLTMFTEIIIVILRNIRNPLIKNTGLLTVEASGTYSYHWALNDYIALGYARTVLYIPVTNSGIDYSKQGPCHGSSG
jgi:hypothetical protein